MFDNGVSPTVALILTMMQDESLDSNSMERAVLKVWTQAIQSSESHVIFAVGGWMFLDCSDVSLIFITAQMTCLHILCKRLTPVVSRGADVFTSFFCIAAIFLLPPSNCVSPTCCRNDVQMHECHGHHPASFPH